MFRSSWVALALVCSSSASAGNGPWVIGKGNASLYTGVEMQRLTKLSFDQGDDHEVIDVDQGLSTFGVKGIGTIGLTDRIELEGTVPWYRVVANREDGGLCAALGADRCATTQSVGILSARAKGLLLDEYFGAPLSLTFGAEVRSGIFTHATRDRITNVGEGTLDFGPFVMIGRTGKIADGYWTAYLGGGWRYRLPNTTAYAGNDRVPGSEFTAEGQWLLAPNTRLALGPSAYLLHRPTGHDFSTVDLTDPDWTAALRITNVRVGGTLVVRGTETLAFSASALATVYAFANPTDVVTLSLGLQFDAPWEAAE